MGSVKPGRTPLKAARPQRAPYDPVGEDPASPLNFDYEDDPGHQWSTASEGSAQEKWQVAAAASE